MKVKEGSFWRHIKSQKIYKVLVVANEGSKWVVNVVYYPVNESHKYYARPLSEWLEKFELLND